MSTPTKRSPHSYGAPLSSFLRFPGRVARYQRTRAGNQNPTMARVLHLFVRAGLQLCTSQCIFLEHCPRATRLLKLSWADGSIPAIAKLSSAKKVPAIHIWPLCCHSHSTRTEYSRIISVQRVGRYQPERWASRMPYYMNEQT